MYYIKDLQSFVGNIDGPTNEEIIALNEFTDDKVGFPQSVGRNYLNNNELRSAFRKIKNSHKMPQYIEIVAKHLGANMDEFYLGMDEEL
jgi:DNA polymerase II large subunit